MGWFKGKSNKSDVKKQHNYDVAVWNFKRDTQNLQWKHADSAYNAQVKTNQQIRDFEYESQVRAYEDAAAIRDFDFANQRAAHNASVEAYNDQLDFNELAEQISLNDNRRKYNDRMTEIGFQNEELLMNHDFTKELKSTEVKHAVEQGQVTESKIAKGVRDAVKDAGFNAREMNNQINTARQEAARKGTDMSLESLQKQGKVMAMGQTGRSAQKNLQSVLAEHGRGQKALLDSLTNEELGHSLNMERLTSKLDSQQSDAALSYTELNVGLSQTAEAAGLAINQSQTKTSMGQRQLQESVKSADLQFTADKQRIALDRYSADLAAEANIAPEAQMAPAPNFPVKAPTPFTQPPMKPPSDERWEATKPIKGAVSHAPGLIESFFSDDRLKYDINRVGTSKKGVPIYTFRYRFDGKHGPKYKGTSAQDLLNTKFKGAVEYTEKDGFLYVNYSKLDVEFEKVT